MTTTAAPFYPCERSIGQFSQCFADWPPVRQHLHQRLICPFNWLQILVEKLGFWVLGKRDKKITKKRFSVEKIISHIREEELFLGQGQIIS